jgi:putative ABC transport system ATP-binding protein
VSNGHAILEARGICRRADHKPLLTDVSLSLAAGERLAVVGPTGSGKSLLLRSMALLDPVDAGDVRFRGRKVTAARVPDFRRQVIYLHQRPALLEGTVESNLRRALQLQAHRRRRFDAERITELVAKLGRDATFLRQSTGDLSGGESQIVALLRAIQLDPAVLLLDEPTAALDANSTSALERLIDTWFTEQPENRSLIWVSHDEQQVSRVAQRVLHMRQGRLLAT